MNKINRFALITMVTWTVLGLSGLLVKPADAHGVIVFAWVEGDRVHVESKFSGGRKVNGGKVVVLDSQGTELLRGTTDAQGKYDFTVPAKTDLKILLQAGMGHQGEWTVSASEIEAPGEAGGESQGTPRIKGTLQTTRPLLSNPRLKRPALLLIWRQSKLRWKRPLTAN